MEYKIFGDTVAIRIDRGEEVVSALRAICEKEDIRSGEISGLGAADHVVVGIYEVETRQYHSNTFDRELELTNLTGNVTRKEGEVYLHLHATFADETGGAVGGHLNECRISGTCEIFLRRLSGEIGRKTDDATGLNVFRF